MPDIDIDFCIERRGEVIDYVAKNTVQPCGTNCNVWNNGGARFDSWCRSGATGSLPEVNKIAKLIPFGPMFRWKVLWPGLKS